MRERVSARPRAALIAAITLSLLLVLGVVLAVPAQALTAEVQMWSAGNTFEDNDYKVLDLAAIHFRWNDINMTWAQWQAAGNDDTGSLSLIP